MKTLITCFVATFVLVALFFFTEPSTAQDAKESKKYDTLVTGGFYFNTSKSEFETNPGIVINDGRFVKIGGLDADGITDFGETVKLDDETYILPGLIDCHAHYNVRLFKKRREEFTVMPLIYLANGATVTFSCGEFDPEEMYRMRQRIEKGEQIGPKLLNSGPYFGRARPGWPRAGLSKSIIREEVDFWAEKGVGGFKAKSIDPTSLEVLIEQAHKHGLTVTGHLDSGYRNSVNPRDAISLGIDRIEHFLGGDAMPDSKSAYASLQSIKSGTPEWKKIVKHFIDSGTYFDATLTAYGYLGIEPGAREEYAYWIDEQQFFTDHVRAIVAKRKPMKGMEIYQRIYDAKLKTIADFHNAGGKITLGTDHVSNGNHLPGFGVHREMDAMSRAGIPNAEVLKIATINGAKAMKIDKDHGSIEVGKVADLVMVKGNPIEKIRNTRKVDQVMKHGKLYRAKELLDKAKGKLGPTSAEEESAW
ncbi:MAG: amidohydrolase family protein [Mariniblastus sp.]